MCEEKEQNPDYDKEKVFREYVDEVVNFYQDSPGMASLRDVASKFDTTLLKVRKVLITAGVFQTETSALVNRLYGEVASIEEIMSLMMGISRTTAYRAPRSTARACRPCLPRWKKAPSARLSSRT